VSCTCCNLRVVCELGKRKPLNSIILSIIAEHLKILLKLLVEPFCLAISLRMVYSAHCGLDTKSLKGVLTDLASKLRAPVRDELLHNTGMQKHLADKEVACFHAGDCLTCSSFSPALTFHSSSLALLVCSLAVANIRTSVPLHPHAPLPVHPTLQVKTSTLTFACLCSPYPSFVVSVVGVVMALCRPQICGNQ
jgi:hypothetical protein